MEQKEGVTQICRLLGVNRQVYYRSIKRRSHKQEIASQVIAMVKDIRLKMPRIGTRKLYHLLYDQLEQLGVGRDSHLQIVPKRQYHITTNSHHRFRKHKNLIAFLEIDRPEQVWVSDITYIGTRENPMYLSLVTDAYSKKIMGYDISKSLNASGAVSALRMAIDNRNYPTKSIIHHSDRGLQYCCDVYQQLLNDNNIDCSMTESYDPYQNAIAERINGILKHEFILGITTSDLELMVKLIDQSIYIYNNERPHWSCKMNTPSFMHLQSQVKIRNYRNKNSTKNKPDAI